MSIISIANHSVTNHYETVANTKALKLGAQQAIAGLDNINVDGLQGFKNIENITANILDDPKKNNKKLENRDI